MLARNPLRYFDQHRQYFTMYGRHVPKSQLRHAGVHLLLEDMADNLANSTVERADDPGGSTSAVRPAAASRCVTRSDPGTPGGIGVDLQPDDLIRVADPKAVLRRMEKVAGDGRAFKHSPWSLRIAYVSPNMEKGLNTMMGPAGASGTCPSLATR